MNMYSCNRQIYKIKYILTVCEIKVLVGAPTGCTSPKNVRLEFLHAFSLYVAMINGSKNVHTPGAHLRKSCTRP